MRYIAYSLASGNSLGIGATMQAAIDMAAEEYPGVPRDWLEVIRTGDATRTMRLYALRLPLYDARVDPGAETVFRGGACPPG